MTQPDVPNPNTYWVEPGRLLAGEYPISMDRRSDRQRLRDYLAAGITMFVDLTEETEIPETGRYLPLCLDEAAELGVQVSYTQFGIPDMRAPSPETMIAILNAIDAALAAGHNIYVHCYAGIGRTGTTVGCFLVRRGRPGAAALDQIALLRQSIPPEFNSPSPITKDQRHMVLGWPVGG